MRPIAQFSALALTACLFACSSADKKDPLLEEAARYHQEATDIQAVIEPQIEQIDSLKTVVLASNVPTAGATVATLDSLKTAFEEWEKNLVEVPGMPHNHSHDHGDHKHHNHADATLKDLPAEQMRDLQRETLNAIKQMQTRLTVVSAMPPKAE
jgi:hypothetical protein